MRNTNFRKFLKQDHQFDLIIVEVMAGGALLALGKYYNAPVIAWTPGAPTKWAVDLVGGPSLPVFYIPYGYIYGDKIGNWTNNLRLVYQSELDDSRIKSWYSEYQRALMMDAFNDRIPKTQKFIDMRRGQVMVMSNMHPLLHSTKHPNRERLNYVGGLHIGKEIEPFPEIAKQFLDRKWEGVVFISFDSRVCWSKLPSSKLAGLSKAFEDFRYLSVLIKSTEALEIGSLPVENVLIVPWISQQDVLAHPNVRFFISSGSSAAVVGEK